MNNRPGITPLFPLHTSLPCPNCKPSKRIELHVLLPLDAHVALAPVRAPLAGLDGIVPPRARHLARQLLERLALRLGDERGGADAAQHEQGVDLHDVVEPGRRVGARDGAARAQRADDHLGDDGADLARGGRQAVRGGAVARGEALAGHDEGGGVGAEVEEELRDDVEGEEALGADLVVREADDAEEDGQHREAHVLDGFAPDGVDRRDRDPVARDGACADDDDVADGGVVELGGELVIGDWKRKRGWR